MMIGFGGNLNGYDGGKCSRHFTGGRWDRSSGGGRVDVDAIDAAATNCVEIGDAKAIGMVSESVRPGFFAVSGSMIKRLGYIDYL